MCTYITASVPTESDLQEIRPLCDKYSMDFRPLSNPFVEAHLDGDKYVLATGDHCDCSTILGRAEGAAMLAREREVGPDEIEKLKRKGWGRTKIDRWLAQKTQASELALRRDLEPSSRPLSDWKEFISGVLSQGTVKHLGLLIHSYSGRLDQEKIEVKGKEVVALADLTDDKLLRLKEDVLYYFVSTYKP